MNYFIKIQYKLQRKDRIRKNRKNYSNSSNDVYIMSCKCNSFEEVGLETLGIVAKFY